MGNKILIHQALSFETCECDRLYPTSSTACTLIAALCWSVTTVKNDETTNGAVLTHK